MSNVHTLGPKKPRNEPPAAPPVVRVYFTPSWLRGVTAINLPGIIPMPTGRFIMEPTQ